MRSFLKSIFFCVWFSLMLNACTAYQPMSFTGGYSDYALGNGKFKIIAKGNGFATSSRVRAIAYLRAAELTEEMGKPFFYVLDDELNVVSNYFSDNINVHKDIYQLIIQPTDQGNGLNVQEIKYKYRSELKIKKTKTAKPKDSNIPEDLQEEYDIHEKQQAEQHPEGIR